MILSASTSIISGIVRWRAAAVFRFTVISNVIGCSMGGAVVLKMAAEYQDDLRGVIGLESTAFAPGRDNAYLHHPAIHGGETKELETVGPVGVAKGRGPECPTVQFDCFIKVFHIANERKSI